MILRNAMTCLFGIGSILLVADSCAASPFPGGRPLRDRAGGYELTVLVDGVPARTYMHDGETYVLGQLGSHYTLRISNHTDGGSRPSCRSTDATRSTAGPPTGDRSAAISSPPGARSTSRAGASRTRRRRRSVFRRCPTRTRPAPGSARDVGVIGVAVFPERYLPPRVYRVPPPYRPYPYPYPRSYDEYYRGGDADSGARAARTRTKRRRPAPRRAPPTPPPADAAARCRRRGRFGRATARVARSEAQPYAQRNRPGLGTEYGEAVSSPIYEVEFIRANASTPSVVLGARYNDREGLLALGIPVDSYYDQTCYDNRTTTATCAARPTRSRSTDRRFAAPPPGWQRPCGWR